MYNGQYGDHNGRRTTTANRKAHTSLPNRIGMTDTHRHMHVKISTLLRDFVYCFRAIVTACVLTSFSCCCCSCCCCFHTFERMVVCTCFFLFKILEFFRSFSSFFLRNCFFLYVKKFLCYDINKIGFKLMLEAQK